MIMLPIAKGISVFFGKVLKDKYPAGFAKKITVLPNQKPRNLGGSE
jgi:hypothetical protein